MFDWDESPELNITPLVDIMLVLLAILMVTTPAVIYEEQINLPKGSKSKNIQKMPDVEIRVDKDKFVYIKDFKYKFSEFADSFVLLAPSIKPGTPIYLRADQSLSYGDVMYIMKSIKEAGFSDVRLVTDG